MKNELTVMNSLLSVLQAEINDYLEPELEALSSENVIIEFPDVDQMPKSTMLYIQPDYAQYDAMATTNDQATFRMSVFILCKRDNQANLTTKFFGYFNALYALLRTNTSLSGEVDFTDINSVNFYPSVEGNLNVKGAEISVSARYTKDY